MSAFKQNCKGDKQAVKEQVWERGVQGAHCLSVVREHNEKKEEHKVCVKS